MNTIQLVEEMVRGLPDGVFVPVRVEWLRDLIKGASQPVGVPDVAIDLSVYQVAAIFGRSPQRIRDWYREGRFPGAWTLGREIRIPPEDVEALGRRMKPATE